MYERHFGFTTKPFSLTPDPTFLYPSRQHTMAMTMLEYGLESQAPFSLLTGDIGSGKTTLVRRLLRDLDDRVAVGLVSNTHAHFKSVHGWALSALGIASSGESDVAQYETLVKFLVREYAKERRTLLIFDEAQNLSMDVLEELRLLSNVNSERDLILQILLVGQPELRTNLLRPELRQFAQRISVDFHLQTLSLTDTHAYISHRLQVAGGSTTLFSPDAVEYVHLQTNGVPRLINQLCDFALLYAFADGRTEVDTDLMMQVVRDRGSGVALPRSSQAQAPDGRARDPSLVPEPSARQNGAAHDVDAFDLILKTGLERVHCALAGLWVPDKNIELALTRSGQPMAPESLQRAQQHLYAWMQQQQRTVVVNRSSTAAGNGAASLKILACPVRDASERVMGVLALFNPPSAPDFHDHQTRIVELLAKKAALIIQAQSDSSAGLVARQAHRLDADRQIR
ncbi:MAG: AAA family ATPase [Steroidobacteraceae bacterium]